MFLYFVVRELLKTGAAFLFEFSLQGEEVKNGEEDS
jgi:hypothetical protein